MRRAVTHALPLVVAGALRHRTARPRLGRARAHAGSTGWPSARCPTMARSFLKAHEDWIAYLSVIPDAWRRPSEPFLKMLEDPNHGWFKEQFAFMTEIPRSRYEFVLKLYDEQRRLAAAGDPAATLTNVRWTGTHGLRRGRRLRADGHRHAHAIARCSAEGRHALRRARDRVLMGWTGHYTGDGAQPLHDTVHHDGWQGANPKGYTTDPRVHGVFETRFVDLMKLEGGDIAAEGAGRRGVLADPFAADRRPPRRGGAPHRTGLPAREGRARWPTAANAEARALVIQQTARGAALLRDLAHTAWVRSGEPPVNDPGGNPIVPAHPRYNPATGSAPAHVAPAPAHAAEPARRRPATARRLAADRRSRTRWSARTSTCSRPSAAHRPCARRSSRRRRSRRCATPACRRWRRPPASCRSDTACLVAALSWSAADIQTASGRSSALVERDAEVRAFVARDLRRPGCSQAHAAGDDAALVAAAWRDAAAGLNRILDVYALGAAPRYPTIDAVSYDPASDAYRRLLGIMAAVMHEQRDDLTTFYEPSPGLRAAPARRQPPRRSRPLRAAARGRERGRRAAGRERPLGRLSRIRRSSCRARAPTGPTSRSTRGRSCGSNSPWRASRPGRRRSSSCRAATCIRTRRRSTRRSR